LFFKIFKIRFHFDLEEPELMIAVFCIANCTRAQWTIEELEKGRRLGISKQANKQSKAKKHSTKSLNHSNKQTQMISSTFLDSLWTPKS
jgi:hypothetical protein